MGVLWWGKGREAEAQGAQSSLLASWDPVFSSPGRKGFPRPGPYLTPFDAFLRVIFQGPQVLVGSSPSAQVSKCRHGTPQCLFFASGALPPPIRH